MDSFNKETSKYKKILVIGSPGAGKTTFSKKLSLKLELPLWHMDDIYWQANWVRTEHNLFLNQLEQICRESKWILDGNHLKTLDLRLDFTDLVILLDYTMPLCLWRFTKRSVRRFLGKDDNLPTNVRQKKLFLKKITIPWHLIKLIIFFKYLTRPKLIRMILEKDIPIVLLKSKTDMENLLNSLT